MKFVKLTENNDNEGESWNFFLQLDGNEKALEQLAVNINTFDDNEESFELNLTPIDEADVDVLVKHTRQGYFDYENKVTGTFTCPDWEDYEDFIDDLYKGGIQRYFK